MTGKIRHSRPALKTIRNSGSTLSRVEANEIAAALGAEPCAEKMDHAVSPITLLVVRQELVNRLQSSGGRPALSDVTRRAKIPLSDAEWLKLEELAAAVASPGFAPTAGQVASVLLSLSLRVVAAQRGKRSARNRSRADAS
jgi:hypothetical protein